MVLPYSDGKIAETIVVPHEFISKKLEYIAQSYDDDLIMKKNPSVKILNFYLK